MADRTAGTTTPRDANRLLARWEYASGQAVLRSRPRALFVELTRHCNLACPMCRNPGEVPPGLRMSEDLFALVEAELFPTADMIDLRGWGESLILPEFEDRARRAAAFGADLRVVTNLSFRRDDILDLLAELGFHVGVSIDSADRDILAFLRGGARLDLIEANLARLAAAYRRRGLGHRLNLYVTCQLPALASLEGVVDLAARAGVHDLRLAPVGTGLRFLAVASVPSEVKTALERVAARAERTGVQVSVTASIVDGLQPNDDDDACLHPWTWCYVAYNGRLGFCDHLIAADHYTFGTLGEAPFEEIWNGAAWSALRREHAGARRPSAPYFHECAWCYKNRHVDCEDIVEPAYGERRLTLAAPQPAAGSETPAPRDAAGRLPGP